MPSREWIVVDSSQEKADSKPETTGLTRPHSALTREIFTLSGSEAVKRILDLPQPEQVVRSMSRVDFFWLIKKIGEEDAIPMLRMASQEQWQYLLDMELWQNDRMDLRQASLWLERLQQADVARLVRWMGGEGEVFAHFYFSKNIRVEVRRSDEVDDLTDGFITFDNVHFIKILNPEHEEAIKEILQNLAAQDYSRYQALLLGLAGVLPAESEEEIYRFRNVRLAEDGFLPHEEALSIYAYLKPESLKRERDLLKLEVSASAEDRIPVPVTPYTYTEETSLLAQSAGRASDPVFLDRIRLEFAGLCNQVLAAEEVGVNDLEVLLRVCRKAAGFVSLGLEKLSNGNTSLAEKFLRDNTLADIFRVGFGAALEVKWEVERWMKTAWFKRSGFGLGFWEEEWAGILSGLLEKRPRLYEQTRDEDPFKDFEKLSEIEACRSAVQQMAVLDKLMESLAFPHHLERERTSDPLYTFSALLFTFWARQELKLSPGLGALSFRQVKDLFNSLRRGEVPPYRMKGGKESFVETLATHAPALEPGPAGILRQALSLLWERFAEEYAMVETGDLERRFLKFILTKP